REVELLRHGVPVEAHAVTHAVRPVLEAGAVGIHPRDVGVRVGRDADVARRADVEIELAVGPERQVLPAVRRVLRERLVHHFHLGRAVELSISLGCPCFHDGGACWAATRPVASTNVTTTVSASAYRNGLSLIGWSSGAATMV